ncbi:MAG: VIT family protein [Paraglaciecola sp.]|nr:VIT family protein [Paraglaciecola sp.]NCT47602.1 VIT family protein [Paraglaciecola sp.]
MNYNHEHKAERIGWIRAVVLGANDGIVSTASLIAGVAASQAVTDNLFVVGLAGLVAGAMSMAAGEYVSVSSQTDIERAELALEQNHIEENWELEVQELALIYRGRGLKPDLADQVARQLMAKDALGSHARDELGITDLAQGQPLQAALFSALSFSAGAALPLLTLLVVSGAMVVPAVAVVSLVALGTLGSVAAAVGGASKLKAAGRVLFWGTLAMVVSSGIGQLFHLSV